MAGEYIHGGSSREELIEDISEFLQEDYELTKVLKNENTKIEKQYITIGTGVFVKGQSVSCLKKLISGGYSQCASGRSWSRLGNLSEFKTLVRQAGFALASGKNSRGNNALVVYKK